MKRLHFRFYGYISAIVTSIILTVFFLAVSVFLFVRGEIAAGIFAVVLSSLFPLILWAVLSGGMIIDFKKYHLIVRSRSGWVDYDLDKIKAIRITFRYDTKYKLYSADISIYLKNGKVEKAEFKPYEWRFSKTGIPLRNKEIIEKKAEGCNLISCCTVE